MTNKKLVSELKRIASQSSGCLCGHFDRCSCDSYLVKWMREELSKLAAKLEEP